jgi:hypothetical protein
MGTETLYSLQKTLFFQRSDFVPDFSQKVEGLEKWEWMTRRFELFNERDAKTPAARVPKIVQ